MTRLTDGNRTIEIELCVWNGEGYDPDWSADFFNVGSLEYDDDAEAYVVDDVDYCIDQACDWENSIGDYCEDEQSENNCVFVTEVETIIKPKTADGYDITSGMMLEDFDGIYEVTDVDDSFVYLKEIFFDENDAVDYGGKRRITHREARHLRYCD